MVSNKNKIMNNNNFRRKLHNFRYEKNKNTKKTYLMQNKKKKLH